MHRIWLIADREFRAYAATASFWLALLTGPALIAVAAVLLSATAPSGPAERRVRILAPDAALAAAAAASLREAGDLEGWRPVIVRGAGAQTSLHLSLSGAERLKVAVEGEASPVAVALLQRDLAHVLASRAAEARGATPPQATVEVRLPPPAPDPDPGRAGRFALMMLLWLNLVGALGMLMQAIVRERANRALESLLAATRPAEVVFGKLLGVGAVSIAVLLAWGAAAGAAGAAMGAGGGSPVAVLDALLPALATPLAAAEALAVFALAYLMYGSVLVGVGATARDAASAQNLARPVFGVLLIVFFTALAQLGEGAGGLDWLVWVPPFTPFMLLLAPEQALSPGERAAAMALLAACAGAAALLAPLALHDGGRRVMRLRRRASAAST